MFVLHAKNQRLRICIWGFALMAFALPVYGESSKVDFEKQIRPLLTAHCVKCHGAETSSGGLRLDAKSLAFQGGDSGKVIEPDKSGESELIRRVASHDEFEMMPPEGKRLSPDDVGLLKRWVDEGASWQETEADRAALYDNRLDHWAWQPVARPEVPQNADSPWERNPVDAFILSKLQEKGLTPSPEADRRTLIRRLSYDLRGLLPSFEEIERFINDPDPQAYEKLVDRYLDSPRFGERWSRHWLDIAHYADTHGFERDMLRPDAWPYRDYVIRSLNKDKPYDQFLEEQIAGDVLWPEQPEAIAATGFLAAGPWDYVGQVETKSDVLRRAAKADALDDLTTQVMTASCGVTVNCARCHDHKIDPISQEEYYSLWAVFAGVRQSLRPLDAVEVQNYQQTQEQLKSRMQEIRGQLRDLLPQAIDLADVVGGGLGDGTGALGRGIDALTGKAVERKMGFREAVALNKYQVVSSPLVDGVVVPDFNQEGTPIASTGLRVYDVPKNSGLTWDAIRNGAVKSQFTLKLGGTDFSNPEHSLLMIHANGAITFDLEKLREAIGAETLKFSTQVGYFGQTAINGATASVYVDGQLKTQHVGIGAQDGLIPVEIEIPRESQFLTIMATDGGNGISHDQVGFGNPRITNAHEHAPSSEAEKRIQALRSEWEALDGQLKSLKEPQEIYAIASEKPATIHVLRRGNPEDPTQTVTPGTLSCLGLPDSLGTMDTPEGERRVALAKWITNPGNPLTRRVIVNRLWHYHFGTGIVDTPGDFGLAGGIPTHPELLDWMAAELLENQWKLKALHRLIVTSATYRQSSVHRPESDKVDSENRYLSRMNARKLDAESVRDSVLAACGTLDLTMYGPGFRDFDYQEAYAPIYEYTGTDRPESWRRSIYRFIVRTTPHPYMMTLDCPDPANLTPNRNVTTTVLQSLTLLNNDFMLQQSEHLAQRIEQTSQEAPAEQSVAAFRSVLGRLPTEQEHTASINLIEEHGLSALCRVLLNTNEFIYID
ncbi:DUF1553 domain-containing protein [Bremerella alba]|uniref:Glycosyl hydrolase family 98 putative carbohydrate-binding module domain-containing protein n=1 Tax=Bremerella alba TaxID=980252 RepID=A0A7V8V2P6_9BACT|nr:DUF1553 domain-containing protein [Bremerella alba]MBA2113805.1 hypothetical protein [Bremerella alba]